MTYWADDEGTSEIVDVTLTKYANNGLLETLVQIALIGNMKNVGHMNVEINEPLVASQRICHTFTIVPANDSFKAFGCFPNSYRMFYDSNLKVIDWESLPDEKMMELTF